MNMLEYLTDAPVQKSVSREVLPRFFFMASGTWRVITFVNRSKQASRSLSWIFRLGSPNAYSTILLYGEVGNLKPDQTKLKKKKIQTGSWLSFYRQIKWFRLDVFSQVGTRMSGAKGKPRAAPRDSRTCPSSCARMVRNHGRGNANRNHNETPPNTHEGGCNQKDGRYQALAKMRQLSTHGGFASGHSYFPLRRISKRFPGITYF